MADQDGALQSINWHGEYKIAALPVIESRNLPGDKILLPQSALEQILAVSPSQTEPNRSSWQQPAPTSQTLPSPLMFRLSTANGNVVYAGIQEFSAEEGEVVVSPYLAEALGLQLNEKDADPEDTPRIRVQARSLPKGTYVRFRPLEAGYNPDDWRALLERQLKNFTTLTKDSILSVRGVKGENFKLLADKLMPEGHGICVVDTDAEVDIEPLNEEQARETMRQIAQRNAGASNTMNSEGGKIDIWKAAEGQVVRGSYINYQLTSWGRSQPLTIILECEGDGHGVDLFASPGSTRQRAQPTAEEHIWADMSSHQIKLIAIQPTNIELENAESIQISVCGYDRPGHNDHSETIRRYTLRVKVGPPPAECVLRRYNPQEEEHNQDDELCSNCKRWIPKSAATMHSIFCARNNEVCSKCAKVFKRGDPERKAHWHCEVSDDCDWGDTDQGFQKHNAVFHEASHECWEPGCEMKGLTIPQLAEHRTSTCPGKLILCQFCHLEVPQEGDDSLNPSAETLLTGLTPHELAEGNRTTDCELCGRIVRLRELAAHVKNHDMERENQPPPATCRNAMCGRTLHGVGRFGSTTAGTHMGQGPGNDIGLCSLCFGPFYVSMHDPEKKALKRRIERRYLSQLMTGCGKKWCSNKWCKTGRKNLGLEPKPSNAAAALKEVKPFVAAALDPGQAMSFCTDETNQRNRTVAESIAADRTWAVEWAVAACEAEKGDAGKARDWLGRYAPTRKA
ncbi:ubiquitin fusion degradation protein [Zalerion maritima]|uniref:Ubiquitin fusion degradation protein n=1 Tax=Zalerion maritima TaxID=339359 RepID=A0AAD5RIR9_9PEZI|nr:ubiquitin fusion degradation protein [Zalerion maritima]